MSPLRSLYDQSLYKNLIWLQGITYNPCREGYGGIVILKDKVSRPFNYAEQNGYLKIWTLCLLGNDGHGEGEGSISN